MKRKTIKIFYLTLSTLILSCSTEPEPIIFGTDQCVHCRMTIMDNRFGAELISDKGKVYKYDAAECMINFVKQGSISKDDVKHYLVIDASKPGNLIDATKAYFLISENFPSPMGANLSSFGSKNDADEYHKKFSGEIKTWNDLLHQFHF